MIYVICNEKGGAGKSSLSQSLCVYLLNSGNNLLLIDADPQRTSSDWSQERSEGTLPPITCVSVTGNLTNALLGLSDKHDNIIVDCGGADSKAMRSALSLADVALLPFRPKRRDLKVAPAMSDLIESAKALNQKLNVFSCITQAPTLPSQRYRIDGAKSLLQELGLNPLTNETRNLNAWDDADESGFSIFEWHDEKAKLDGKQLFDELMEKSK